MVRLVSWRLGLGRTLTSLLVGGCPVFVCLFVPCRHGPVVLLGDILLIQSGLGGLEAHDLLVQHVHGVSVLLLLDLVGLLSSCLVSLSSTAIFLPSICDFSLL